MHSRGSRRIHFQSAGRRRIRLMMVSKAILLLLIGVCSSGAERDLSQFTPLGQTRPVNADYQPPAEILQQTKPAVRPSRHQRSADPNSPIPPPGHQSKPQTLPGSVGVAAQPLPAEFVKPAVLPASLPGRQQRSADPNSPTPPPGHQSKPQTLPGSVGVAAQPLPADLVQPSFITDDLDDIELALDATASLEYSSEDFSDSPKLSPIIGIVLPSGVNKPTIGVTIKPLIGGIGLLKPTIVTNTTITG